MKTRILLLAIGVFFIAANCYGGDLKIGIVEVEYILKNSKELLNEKGKLREKFNKLQEDLNKREKVLKESIEDFKAQSALYSPEAKKEKEAELKKEEQDLLDTFKEYQENIKKNEQLVVKSLIEQMKEIAKEKGYDLVIERNSGFVIYSSDGLDINKEVIESIDSRKKEQ